MTESETLSTGEFCRRTRLSRKALRVYERTGLLRPAGIDPDNGYRRYDAGQVRAGQVIALLRGVDLGLAEIGAVICDLEAGGTGSFALLERLIIASQRRHADRVLLLRHVQTTLGHGGDPMFPIQTRHVPARRVMSVQRRVHAGEIPAFCAEVVSAFAARLGDEEPIRPFCLIYHGAIDESESDGPIEAVLGCPDGIDADETVGIRIEPAHDEAYTTITRSLLAYPAILAAYDAVACSDEVRARPDSRLACREVYLVDDPGAVDDDVPVCDVAFPLG